MRMSRQHGMRLAGLGVAGLGTLTPAQTSEVNRRLGVVGDQLALAASVITQARRSGTSETLVTQAFVQHDALEDEANQLAIDFTHVDTSEQLAAFDDRLADLEARVSAFDPTVALGGVSRTTRIALVTIGSISVAATLAWLLWYFVSKPKRRHA